MATKLTIVESLNKWKWNAADTQPFIMILAYIVGIVFLFLLAAIFLGRYVMCGWPHYMSALKLFFLEVSYNAFEGLPKLVW